MRKQGLGWKKTQLSFNVCFSLNVCVCMGVSCSLEIRLWWQFTVSVCVCVCCRGNHKVTHIADTTTGLAGKQGKKSFPEDVRERAWLSEREQNNIPENTRPHSALLRMEILHGPTVAMRSTALDFFLRNVRREGPLSTQRSLYLFLMLKQRYSSHVRCQLTDVCFQKCSKESKEREMYVHMYVCIHVSAAGVISNTCVPAVLIKYIFHTCPAR